MKSKMLSDSDKRAIRRRIRYREYDIFGQRYDYYGADNEAGSWYMEISYSLLNMNRSIQNMALNGKKTNWNVDYFMSGYATRRLRKICQEYPEMAERYESFFGENIYKNRTSGENSAEVDNE